jgi:hypothetical protein
MKHDPTLSDIVTQLAGLNRNLGLLNATLQDFRWWMMEQMQQKPTEDGQLTFWDQYQPPVTPNQ